MNLTMRALAAVLVALVGGVAPARAVVTIDWRYVGDAGNLPDTRHDPRGFGAVAYDFRIGTYEVTNGQYREFLNAKARVGDPLRLYNEEMTSLTGGIQRTGDGTAASPWTYHPKDFDPQWDRRPVNFITMWDAARFTNWLHNGQGDGDTEFGAYFGLDDESLFTRLPDARVFIPTEDEWYKAAYYDPHKNGPSEPGYWEYPTRSDVQPTRDLPPGADMVNGSANFGSLGNLTPVGAYAAKPSTSPYGTFDQGGNLWEWNETFVIDNYFGLRGGSFDNIYGLDAHHRDSYPALFENPIMGFRLAAPVPEPSTMLLATGLCCAAACAVKRRVSTPCVPKR